MLKIAFSELHGALLILRRHDGSSGNISPNSAVLSVLNPARLGHPHTLLNKDPDGCSCTSWLVG